MSIESNFISRLPDDSLIAATHCDIQDSEGLKETIKDYLKTDVFRTSASRVLKAHSIDPKTIKRFNVDVEEDGSIYLSLPTTGRRFKISTDTTFANAAFGKTSTHPTKPRSDIVKTYKSPFQKKTEEKNLSPPSSPVEPKSPQTPPPAYFSPTQTNPNTFPFPAQLPQSPYNIGYIPHPQGGFLPVYLPTYPIVEQNLSSQESDHGSSPNIIHTSVVIDQPLSEEPKPQKTATTLVGSKNKDIKPKNAQSFDQLRAVDRKIIQEYLSNLEDAKTAIETQLGYTYQELEDKKSLSSSIYAGITLSRDLQKQDIENLEKSINILSQKCSIIDEKIKKYSIYLSLPENTKIQTLIYKDQALIQHTKDLESMLEAQKQQTKQLFQELSETQLNSEFIKFEEIDIEQFLQLFVHKRIDYADFQEILNNKINQSQKVIQEATYQKEQEESSLPYRISTLLFNSSKEKAERSHDEINFFDQTILKHKRMISMFNRLQKTPEKEFKEIEQTLYNQVKRQKEQRYLQKKISSLEKQLHQLKQTKL